MAVEAPAVLQGGDAVPQWLRGEDPVRAEQVTVQAQLGGGHLVDLGDHPGPVQLDQGADEWPEPDELIAGAGQQPDRRAPGTMAAQPRNRKRLPRPPAEFVDEREDGISGPDRLQPRQGLLCDGDLDLIQHHLIGPGQPLAGQVP